MRFERVLMLWIAQWSSIVMRMLKTASRRFLLAMLKQSPIVCWKYRRIFRFLAKSAWIQEQSMFLGIRAGH